MISFEIKKHKEPITQTYSYSQQAYVPYHNMNNEQRTEWETLCNNARRYAKDVYKIGDKVTLNTGSQITIVGYVENDSDVIRASGGLCVLYGICEAWGTGTNNQVRYAITEFKPNTHVKSGDHNEISE